MGPRANQIAAILHERIWKGARVKAGGPARSSRLLSFILAFEARRQRQIEDPAPALRFRRAQHSPASVLRPLECEEA